MHFSQTYLLHKAIKSFFSSYHGPDQEENCDVNHKKDPATKQLFQLCQIPFMGSDSDLFSLLSLIAAEMPLMGKTFLRSICFPSNGGPAWEEEQDFSSEKRQVKAKDSKKLVVEKKLKSTGGRQSTSKTGKDGWLKPAMV